MAKVIHPSAGRTGIRSIALFEALKGVAVILAGLGLLSLIHRDVQEVVEQLVAHLHLNPAKNIGRVFVEAANHLDDSRLRLLAVGALVYAAVRFAEAYGLWHGRKWAEWFALVSGGIYLPAEIFELTSGFTWLKIIALMVNLFVVAYLGFALANRARTEAARPE